MRKSVRRMDFSHGQGRGVAQGGQSQYAAAGGGAIVEQRREGTAHYSVIDWMNFLVIVTRLSVLQSGA